MASNNVTMNVRLVFADARAMRELRRAIDALNECEDLASWRPEIKRAIKSMRYVAKNVGLAASDESTMYPD